MGVKIEAKKEALGTWAISLSWVTRSPVFFRRGLIFSLVFLFVIEVLVEAYLVVLDVSSQIQFRLGLRFSNLIHGSLDNVSIFLTGP